MALLGATFAMNMKIGFPTSQQRRGSDFEENRSIGVAITFRQFRVALRLSRAPGGTQVTESFTYDKPGHLSSSLWAIRKKNRRAMEASLGRLEQLATSSH